MLGSSATTEPCTPEPSAPSPSKAAVCAFGSRVSCTRPPCGEALLSRSTSRVTKSRGSSPERTAFWVCSMPDWVKKEKKPVTAAYLNGWL